MWAVPAVTLALKMCSCCWPTCRCVQARWQMPPSWPDNCLIEFSYIQHEQAPLNCGKEKLPGSMPPCWTDIILYTILYHSHLSFTCCPPVQLISYFALLYALECNFTVPIVFVISPLVCFCFLSRYLTLHPYPHLYLYSSATNNISDEGSHKLAKRLIAQVNCWLVF